MWNSPFKPFSLFRMDKSSPLQRSTRHTTKSTTAATPTPRTTSCSWRPSRSTLGKRSPRARAPDPHQQLLWWQLVLFKCCRCCCCCWSVYSSRQLFLGALAHLSSCCDDSLCWLVQFSAAGQLVLQKQLTLFPIKWLVRPAVTVIFVICHYRQSDINFINFINTISDELSQYYRMNNNWRG